MRSYFIIYNKRLGKYFEQDFAGWSYVCNRDNASKFKSKTAAEDIIKWLKQEHECVIQEI
jgi:tRNA splicing ligase